MKTAHAPFQRQCWPYWLHTVTKLEILTYMVTIPLGTIYFIAPEWLLGLLIPGSLFIILAFCWWYFGGLYFPFFTKYILFQFRTFVILMTLFAMVILDIISFFLLSNEYRSESPISTGNGSQAILISVLDDIFWILVLLLLIQGDSVYPKPSNFSRLLLPLYATSNCVRSIYKSIYITNKYDIVLIHYFYGKITFLYLWRAVFMQLIWFLNNVTFAIFYDPKHEYCTLANGPLLRKAYLSDIQYHTYTKLRLCPCCRILIKTDWLFVFCAIIYIPIICIYYVSVSNSSSLIAAILSIILLIVVMFGLIIFVYYHFERKLYKLLLLQFRSGLLLVALLLLTYALWQRIIWNTVYCDVYKQWNIETIIIEICFHFCYCIAVILLIVRDGIIYKYPNWFTLFIGLFIFIISVINILEDTFFSNILVYPSWFLLIEKEAFFQIFSMTMLVLFRLFKDRKHAYFVLIREKLKRDTIFKELMQFREIKENETIVSAIDLTTGFDKQTLRI